MEIDRVPCCVPLCGRGIGRDSWIKRWGRIPTANDEYICQKHWQEVPVRMKRAWARVRRRERRFDCALPAAARLWRRIRREVGVGAERIEIEGETS